MVRARVRHPSVVLRPIVAVNLVLPGLIRHVGPMASVETGRILETLLVHIQRKALVFGIERQRAPQHRKQFFAQAQEMSAGATLAGRPRPNRITRSLTP